MVLTSYSAFVATLCTLAGQGANAAITLDLGDDNSIKRAASTIAYDLMSEYTGNRTGDTPGNLPDPYYWWECGAMFGTMINYWYYTGDTTYNEVTMQAMLHQIGPDKDYMPENQTKTLGNDDQSFWGMAALTAAETNFEAPPEGYPGWLALAQAVFNEQTARWDEENCGGGLRWQKFSFNVGYNYKNTISNGCFFNIAARLALYTGNQTYADWAVKIYNWTTSINMLDAEYKVYDGAHTPDCAGMDKMRWTYNAGIFMMGAAAMYNFTDGEEIWKTRINGLLDSSESFYNNGVLFEGCELGTCNVDQQSFKAYFTREMAATAELAPFSHDVIMTKISVSAMAAVKTCTAGTTGNKCGLKWTTGVNDAILGVGESMSALEIVQSNLVDKAPGWVSARKGTGNSAGDVNAGLNGDAELESLYTQPATTGDKAGAGILTALILIGVVGGTTVMVI
ncbi:glycoside hydrolase family 76 protein [Bisporella sp. PMI_857]|nr:glycoside hydrolase family 76 protein [Bisporella sp. PMI_857]